MEQLTLAFSELPADLIAVRDALKSRFPSAGLTWLVVKHNGQWIGGKHRGGGVFRG